MRPLRMVLLFAVLAVGSAVEAAEGPGPACTGPESGLTNNLVAWSGVKARPVTTAHGKNDVERVTIEVGKRTPIIMAVRSSVALVIAQGGAEQPAQYDYSGMASFMV